MMNDVTGISSEAQKAIWRLKDRIAELEATFDDSQKMANSIIGDYDNLIAELEAELATCKKSLQVGDNKKNLILRVDRCAYCSAIWDKTRAMKIDFSFITTIPDGDRVGDLPITVEIYERGGVMGKCEVCGSKHPHMVYSKRCCGVLLDRIADLEGWLAILKEQNAGAEALAIENVEMKGRLEKVREWRKTSMPPTCDCHGAQDDPCMICLLNVKQLDTALAENEEDGE